MKFSLFALPALSLLAAAAPTVSNTVVEQREAASSLEQWITGLTTEVKGYTAHMNQVTAALPADASDEQKKAAATSAIKDIAGITSAFQATNDKIKAVQKQKGISARQTLGDLPDDVLGQLDGRPIVLANLLLPLLQELNPALQSVLVTLSLGEVYVALQPLLRVQLPALVTGLSTLVAGLLAALAPLLAGLGGILGPLLLGLGL